MGSLLVTVAPAAYAADRDCSDFASQRAAQIFYLKQGGPRSDPHRLDADDDGVACDTNPAPYYTKRTLPKPPPIASAIRLNVSPAAAIAGEPFRATVQVLPRVQRTVILQRRGPNTVWKRIDSGRTSKRGGLSFRTRTQPRTSQYRAVLVLTSIDRKRYAGARSETLKVDTQKQAVILSMPNAALVGQSVGAVAEASPVRRGREVVLQRRRGSGGWSVVARGAEPRSGRVEFRVKAATRGDFAYRAVVLAEGGAQAVRSNRERLRVTVPAPEDTTPPPVPMGLAAIPGDAQVQLEWSAVTAADLAGYVVYQSSGGGPWVRVGRVVSESSTIGGLTNGTQYAFAVAAFDTARNESGRSKSSSATPVAADTTPPPIPSAVNASAGNQQVTVTWEAVAASDLAGYAVYRREIPNGFWVRSDVLTAAATTATIGGLTNGTSYEFAVAAFDQTGNESAQSATSTATPMAPPPAAPTGLTGTAGDAQVDLRWDAVGDTAVVGYRVYFRASVDQSWTLDPNGLTATTESVVSGLTNGVEHILAVTSVRADGTESNKSSTVTVTPTAP